MNDGIKLKQQDLTEAIIGVFYEVYNELGSGFLESVYENALAIALRANGLSVKQQTPIPVWFRRIKVGDFVADLVVEDSVLLELKAVRSINDAHLAQLVNYLKATEIEVGLLFNFGQRPEFKRRVFDNPRKETSGESSNGSVFSHLFSAD